MANILKNQLYPYIKNYINEYLHGFSKEKIDIQLAKGEVKLEKMSLRPDTINKIMDEKNVPFWIKVGLITKISVGASVLSVIGEIPLEVEIDGVDIILSPSYKWIIKNIENLHNSKSMNIPNPLGNDIFNKKTDDFDLSIFNKEKIQEIFKDKTILSNVINNLFKSLYTFFSSPNFVAIIKIKNVHIRFEDDELMNYTGDIALGMRINLIQIKVGCKGNMKKDSIKLQTLDIYWENDAKILIPNHFLNNCIVNGKLQEKYYTNLKKVRFERFQYLPSTKFIIQDFNFTLNVGTRCESKGDIDIFDIKTLPSMVYLQLASNELNVNIYPEIAKIQSNFTEFLAQFPIIEKVKDYRPFIKPTEVNSMKYVNLVENYRKNVIDKNNKNKMLVRDWINYFYWFEKSKKGEQKKQINPVRTEFVRFYNVCIKKVDVYKIIKEKQKEEQNNDEKEGKKEKEEKGVKKPKKEEIKNRKREKEENQEIKEESEKKKIYIYGGTPIGDEDENENENINQTPGETPDGEEPTPGETPEEEETGGITLIPNELSFSTRIDLLIKGFNINLHSPLKDKKLDYISLSISGVEIQIKLAKEKFEFNFKINTIDLGPNNLNMGQMVIIQPKSYRKAIPEQNMTSINSNIPYGNLSTYNYVSLPNSNLGSSITGLIKKYNPKHEDKIKRIDEALDLAASNSHIVNLAASDMGDFTKFKRQNKLGNKTPFGDNCEKNNLGRSAINLNMEDLGKTYGSVFVPRNVTFAKNLIDNYEGNSLQSKKYYRKKNNELNISQAINDYNSYKNQEKLKTKLKKNKSPVPIPSLSNSCFNLRESQFGINPFGQKGKNIPLNLLEIFSNTEVGALSLQFTKYNNPVTIDNLSIQIGTIRLNLFVNYLLSILRILSEYKKATNVPKIAKSGGTVPPEGQKILEMQEYFYNYLLKKIPDIEKTDSMNEYMEYLKREINSKKRFSSKPEHFALNQVFSFFPKGFDFHFDYENIEMVAYDKDNIVSSKMIIPSNEIILSLTLTKIFIKLFELEVQITDLNKCENIIEQLKDLAKDKFKVVEIVIEPCYRQIKDGIEPLLKDIKIEYKKMLKNQNQNINENINTNINTNLNTNINTNINNNQNTPKGKENNQIENENENKNDNDNDIANYNDNDNDNDNENDEIENNENENENNEIENDDNENENENNEIENEENENENEENENEENENEEDNLEINNSERSEKQSIIENQDINQYSEENTINQKEIEAEQQELLLRKQKEEELLIQRQKQKEEEQELLIKQQEEKEKEKIRKQNELQRKKESLIHKQQLERNQKLLLLKQQQEQRKQQELNQNQIQNNSQMQKQNQKQINQIQNTIQQKKSQTQQQIQTKTPIPPPKQKQNLQQKNITMQSQLRQQNNNVKNKDKVAKKVVPTVVKKSKIPKPESEDFPEDTVRKENVKHKKNISKKVQKQHSNTSSQKGTGGNHQNINTQMKQQQYINYNSEPNNINNKNINYAGYNIITPNLNNNEYIYQNNNQQNPYVVSGNNKQIIESSYDGFNLFHSTGYV